MRLGTGVVDNRMIFSVLAFMLVYGATVITLSMVLLLTDLDPVTAFSAVLASVHCMGPGLGSVGPAGNFAVLTDFQIWVCSLAMLLGLQLAFGATHAPFQAPRSFIEPYVDVFAKGWDATRADRLARQKALHDLQARLARHLLRAGHTGADPGIHACAHVALLGQPGL